MSFKLGASAIVIALSLAACQQEAEVPADEAAAETAQAEAATPPFSVNRQMVSLIDNEAHVLWGAEREGHAPQTEQDWNTIEDHALQIVAAGYMLRHGGTGPEDAQWSANPAWGTHAQAMVGAAMAAASAAEGENMDALLAANGNLVDSCLACHQQFKPEIPTEGRTHQHDEESET